MTVPSRGVARVISIVLTYNAPGSLRSCLNAIRAQTHEIENIVVVDNASDPPVSVDPSGGPPVDVVRLPDNRGPAGGHAAGLRRLMNTSVDFGWVMDDDCVPEPDCLQRLVRAALEGREDVVAFPRWIQRATGEVTSYPAWCGVLLPMSAVRVMGVPREDFFWWAEDTEYLNWRRREAGYDKVQVMDAVVYHDPIRRGPVRPPWKIYYETRNSIYYRLHVKKRKLAKRIFQIARTLARTFASIVLTREMRGPRARAFARGIWHGIAGKLGKTMDPAAEN